MTPVVVISGYFLALGIFLGLDIISKVPATIYALVLAALGTVTAVVVVGGVTVALRAPTAASAGLGLVAAGLGAAAAAAGLASVVRLVRPLARKTKPS